MSEDTPGNPGVAHWPDPDSAWWAVRKMQLKLHRWASEDSARRFDDLYNLVSDPAFLVHAFERVATNAGARTPGVDRVTVARIRSRSGLRCSWTKSVRNSRRARSTRCRCGR
jgi:RNA-directed DNA polymerase